MKCTHDNCFTCPYEDCIVGTEQDDDEKKRKKQEYNKRFYQKNKEKINAQSKAYYREHADEINARAKEKRKRRDSMRKRCGYSDCFNCPLRDCIVDGTFADEPNVSDYLPKQSEEEKKAKKREYMRTRYKKRKAATA